MVGGEAGGRKRFAVARAVEQHLHTLSMKVGPPQDSLPNYANPHSHDCAVASTVSFMARFCLATAAVPFAILP